jgi:sensor histidine kinase regulating citrate/malate metabolism
MFTIKEVYDDKIPILGVNEFIIWEIIEPLIQNSISHNADKHVNITITTNYEIDKNKIILKIADDGSGIKEELLEKNEDGIKKLFLESVSTKNMLNQQYGLGCYIAHILATKYLGWTLDVENSPEGGCFFELTIPV